MIPIVYTKDFLSNPNEYFTTLWSELAWVRSNLPRREYYWNLNSEPYTYGKGVNAKTYQSQILHPLIEKIRLMLLESTGTDFNVCFLNGYEDQRDHLGWHSDDSPEMDNDSAIAIISLGAEREIWFRPNETETIKLIYESTLHTATLSELAIMKNDIQKPTKVLLNNGSLCLMKPNMQSTHQHRIPKCDRVCGARISLTFRVYK